MKLHEMHQGVQANKKRRRIGRGPGSGHGKTCGRGSKGQKSRAGSSRHPAFQGGAMPLVRRVPKRGFTNRYALDVVTVNIGQLDSVFADGDEVNPETLRAKSLAKGRYDVLKILGDGQLTRRLRVAAHRFSQSARESIQRAGGEVIELEAPLSVEEKRAQAGGSAKRQQPTQG